MSVSMSKANGVTVLSMNSDPESAWPPLCQIFKSLCYSPVCCSSSQHLRRVQRTSQSALGALQILVGLLIICFGSILFSYWYWGPGRNSYWLGALFILFGIVSILSEKFPSPCLVIVNVILNLTGVAFAITAIVLYSVRVNHIGYWGMCDDYDYDYRYRYRYRYRSTAPTAPTEKAIMKQRCLEGEALTSMIQRGIFAVLIVLSVLEFCLVISSAVLGIKAVRARGKGGKENTDEPERNKPHLEEVTTNPAV